MDSSNLPDLTVDVIETGSVNDHVAESVTMATSPTGPRLITGVSRVNEEVV